MTKKYDIFFFIYLDNTLIYTTDNNQGCVTAIQQVLNLLKENKLFAKLAKY